MSPAVPVSSGLSIGPVVVDPPVVLAPLAGFTCLPFRLLCRRAGAGMVCTEMVSARAICYNNVKTFGLMSTCAAEQPVSLQLFGDEPDTIAQAVPRAVEAGAAVIDINMGCTVPKVVRIGGGVSLLGDPNRAVEIARAAVGCAGAVPVTVKLRVGVGGDDDSYLELAVRLAEAGVSAIAAHGRTARQGFSGPVDLARIRRLVEAVSIPIIGNGDITCPDDALRMVEETGCAGVMVGRGALGDPALLGRCAAALRGEAPRPGLSAGARLAVVLYLVQALALDRGEEYGVKHGRTHLAWLTRGIQDGAALRRNLIRAASLRELADVIQTWAAAHPE